MKTPVDDRLRAEAARYSFRFACEDCVHFDAARAVCGHGYPPAPRRASLQESSENATIAFCKEFDLGAGDSPEGS
ncbi:MAG TPA: hypothetical protein VGM56_06290 [Byssovorax sp.]|jgi:hypothetical protein